MNITFNININVKVLIGIVLIIFIALLLIYKNTEAFTADESILNIAKIYADASGTAYFNDISVNNLDTINNLKIQNNLDISGVLLVVKQNSNSKNLVIKDNIISNNLDVSGVLNAKQINTADLITNNMNIKNKLLFSTDASNFEGIHTFWMGSGYDTTCQDTIRNPNEETYSADKWICTVSNSAEYMNQYGYRPFVDSASNLWCITKSHNIGSNNAFVQIICYPISLFSKVWGTKGTLNRRGGFNPGNATWNTTI